MGRHMGRVVGDGKGYLIRKGRLDAFQECEAFRSLGKKRSALKNYGTPYVATTVEADAHHKYQRRYLAQNKRRVLMKNSRRRAKQKQIEHSIGPDDIIVNDDCPCCGTTMACSKGKYSSSSPSLDRIDSAKGYVPGNVQVICHGCNSLKGNGTAADHLMMYRFMMGGKDVSSRHVPIPHHPRATLIRMVD